ncbi:kunitz-type serine protease inhibitor 6 isoform X1 [Dermacentor silvarum]|uniref:kunitz-type serine protease inhibitor 6 isoform X1 n=1 Tax=Dermacentor silvarum TaxID=543639 RepID=UPI0018993B72|nr:kunitz-type serine protease inhibitor 6 isoform X1 [Dermacentor silvarum]
MKPCILLAFVTAAFAATNFERQCDQGPDPGLCRAFLPMWWYNAKTDKCEEFIYGGCGGNDNRYETRRDCEETCSTKKLAYRKEGSAAALAEGTKDTESVSVTDVCGRPPFPGPCLAYFPRFYYEPKTNSCRPFIYGGCKSNGNNFETRRACTDFCVSELAG